MEDVESMSIQRISSLLVGVCFVGGAIATSVFAPWENIGSRTPFVFIIILSTFFTGMILTWKGIWPD